MPSNCRSTAPATTFDVPAQVARGAIQKDKMPVKLRFDGEGPLIEVEIGQWRATVPLAPATVQREIYMHGSRYWRMWANYEQQVVEQKQAEETKTKQKKLTTNLLCIGGAIAVVVVAAVLVIVFTRKNRAAAVSKAPVRVPEPQRPVEAPTPAIFSAERGKLDSLNLL